MTFRPLRARLLLLIIAASLIMAFVGYGAWWYHLSGTLRDGVDRWVAERNAAGWAVATGEVAVGGFPGKIRLSLSSPSVADPYGDAWHGPPVLVTVAPWSPGRVHVSAPGNHLVAVVGMRAFEVAAADATADLAFDRQGLSSAALALAELAAGPVRLRRLDASLHRLAVGPAVHTTPTLALSVVVGDLDLPDDPRLVFGHRLTAARLEARLMGSLPNGAPKVALAAWRDDGGTLEIDSLSLNWPPLGVSGTGTLALDQEMQPLLASSCTIRGLFEAIDTLAEAGNVRAKDANLAKLVLGLMTKPAPDGAKEWVVPVTLENRTLYVGPAALMKVPALAW